MVIDEVYRILQYAFDNKLTIKEAITKLNVNVKYSTVITYKNKYNITDSIFIHIIILLSYK